MEDLALQRQHSLREVFDASGWIAQSSSPWQLLPSWCCTSCRLISKSMPGFGGVRKGFVLLPCRWMVERSFGWFGKFSAPVARLRLRLPVRCAAGPSFPHLRYVHTDQGRTIASVQRKFITCSRPFVLFSNQFEQITLVPAVQGVYSHRDECFPINCSI